MQLLLGTNNRGKIMEMTEVLSELPIKLLTPSSLTINAEVDENGTTFQENALLKARHFHRHSKLPTVADDSGIVVDALKNELVVQTRRWGAGASASDEEWISHFLERMSKEGNKNARFLCCLAYIDADGREHIFEGSCNGTITQTLEATYLPGLPISACFRPNGFPCVYSAMSIEQKNSTSHRGKALLKLKSFLKSH
jgi:XTP/dITP diphosphohydrolase